MALIHQNLHFQAGCPAAHLFNGAFDALRIAVTLHIARDERAHPLRVLEQAVDHLRLQRAQQQ